MPAQPAGMPAGMPEACLQAAGMPAGMPAGTPASRRHAYKPQAGGAPAPSLGGGLLKALSESSKRLSKRFRLGSICLEKGRAGPFPRGWALKSFLRELDALSPSTGFARFSSSSVRVGVCRCAVVCRVLCCSVEREGAQSPWAEENQTTRKTRRVKIRFH